MTRNRPDELAALAGLSNLDDPLRRRLYDHVVDSTAPVSRDQAASATEISRTLAAYHLDKMADAGLLTVSYQRPPGRGGPGAGRPAKFYAMATREMTVSVPPRDYELLARLLVASVEHDTSGAVQAAVNAAARDAGRQASSEADGELLTALHNCGYLPHSDDDGCITLRNCPFHAVAKDHQDVVCALNLQLVEGLIAGSIHRDDRAELSPRTDRCCVIIHGAGRTFAPASATTAPSDKTDPDGG